MPQSWVDAYIDRKTCEYEILTFGYAEGVDIRLAPNDDFNTVLDKLPSGWVPDYCMLIHADWLMLPKGIEYAPFPLVYVTADWDFRIPVARTCAESTDLTIVIGEDSKEGMQAVGGQKVEVFHYFGVMKEHFTAIPKKIKDRRYDIVFTGSFNDVTHLDRSQWVLKLCELADRHNIYINSGGGSLKDYLELLQNSKLTFTSNRRGEVQLRFTDAAAQGTVTIDPGIEVKKYFTPDEEYISVDMENLAEQIDKYLNNEDKLQEISDRVYKKVQKGFESRRLFSELMKCVDNLLNRKRGYRRFCELDESEKSIRRGEIYYYSFFTGFINKDRRYLQQSISEFEKATSLELKPRAMAGMAVAAASLGFSYTEDDIKMELLEKAISILNNLISLHPFYAVAYYNLGLLYLSIGNPQEALATFKNAVNIFGSDKGVIEPWCLYNLEFDQNQNHTEYLHLGKGLNIYLLELCKGYSQAKENIRKLFQSAIFFYLSVIEKKVGNVFNSLEYLKNSHNLYPSGIAAKNAAILSSILGFQQESLKFYMEAMNLLPFDIELRIEYIKHLYQAGCFRDAINEIRTTFTIVKTVKVHTKWITFLNLLIETMDAGFNKSAVYSHDSCKEMLLNSNVEKLFTWIRKNPSDYRLVSRVIEIWDTLGRKDKVSVLLKDYDGRYANKYI